MSSYTFHVLYQHSTPHAVTTLVVLLSASVCVFLWFNRKSKPSAAIPSTASAQIVAEPPSTNLSKETALEVRPPTPSTPAPSPSLKKSKPTKGDKKGDKTKKRQGKQDGPPAPKVRTLAHRRPARRLEDSAAAPITEDQQEEQHAHQYPSIEASSSQVKPPEDGMSTGSQNSPPRAASPSPSEATTATTAATIQSSTLILTPPPTVLPSLVSLPAAEHEKDARVSPTSPHSNASVGLDDAGHEEPNSTVAAQIENDGWIRVDNETPTIERREPLAPLLVPPPTIPIDITSPTSPQNGSESPKPSPIAPTSNIPPPDDGETVVPSPTPSDQPPAIILSATPDKSESPASTRPSPSSRPHSITPSEYPGPSRTRQGSSGGVGLGIPGATSAPGSQSRAGVSRSSPANSPLRTGQIPLPPRHRRHQPGQPPQQLPSPLLQPLPPYAHYGGRPSTPGSGLRSPVSPVVPFVGAPGWIPGPAYSPVAQQPPPQAFLRPYPPPGYMHPPGPPGPHGGAAPPAGLMPYLYHPGSVNNSHGRSRSASDISPYQGVVGMTSISTGAPPASQDRTTATGSRSASHEVKGKKKDAGEGEADEEEDDFVVEFPTLNPTPGKPSQSSESETAEGGVSSGVAATQPAEQQPTGWMSPGYATYPPEMVGYPAPWSPQAAAYFQPRPYPHPSQIPGASTPSSSSTSSSPAWTHLGLPPPNGVNPPRPGAPLAEGGVGDQEKQQQQPYSAGPEEDLRRQSMANSIANKPGTSTSSASGSATSSPRIGFNHLHPMAAPSAMQPYGPHHSPLTPTSGHVPLMPNPHLMRQGLPPSPGPMAGSWHGNAVYLMPGPVPPHPQWIAAQNSPRSGTPSGDPSYMASPNSRSSSPFVAGRSTPPVQAMYPGYFAPPPHPNYPYGPAPPPPMQHPLMTQGMPPTPGPSYVNGRYSSANSSPLQSRSRKNTASVSSAGGAEEDDDDSDHDSLADVPDALVEAIFKDPEGFKAASVSSGRSSRGGSRAASIRSASEAGGGGSEKGSVCGSPAIVEEPPQTA